MQLHEVNADTLKHGDTSKREIQDTKTHSPIGSSNTPKIKTRVDKARVSGYSIQDIIQQSENDEMIGESSHQVTSPRVPRFKDLKSKPAQELKIDEVHSPLEESPSPRRAVAKSKKQLKLKNMVF